MEILVRIAVNKYMQSMETSYVVVTFR